MTTQNLLKIPFDIISHLQLELERGIINIKGFSLFIFYRYIHVVIHKAAEKFMHIKWGWKNLE